MTDPTAGESDAGGGTPTRTGPVDGTGILGLLALGLAFLATLSRRAELAQLRAQRIAFENNLPLIYLVDSAGVFLPMQDEIFPDEDDFGRIFRNNAVISAAGIPQYAAIMGNCGVTFAPVKPGDADYLAALDGALRALEARCAPQLAFYLAGADPHEGEAGRPAGQGCDLGFELGDDFRRDFVAVDQFHEKRKSRPQRGRLFLYIVCISVRVQR